MTIRTVDGLTAILDQAHWQSHIVARHPELNGHQEKIVETLRSPDGVFRSKRDRTTRIYVKTYTDISVSGTVLSSLGLTVCVRENDGFVVTAHFAAAMWRSLGEQIWPS